jgi:hypothetical protein
MGPRDESGRVPQSAQLVCQRLCIGLAVAKHQCLHKPSCRYDSPDQGLAEFPQKHCTVRHQGSAAHKHTWWKVVVDSTRSSCWTLASSNGAPSMPVGEQQT